MEAVKPIIYNHPPTETLQTLYTCIDIGLRLLHPFMPFITEKLFSHIPKRPSSFESLVISPFPQTLYPFPNNYYEKETDSPFFDNQIEKEFIFIEKINKEIRSIKTRYTKGNKKNPHILLYFTDTNKQDIFDKYKEYSITLTKCKDITVLSANDPIPGKCATTMVEEGCQVFIDLSLLDLDYSKEITRLKKNLDKIETQLEKVTIKMNVCNYEKKVPDEIKTANLLKRNMLIKEIDTIQKEIDFFNSLLI